MERGTTTPSLPPAGLSLRSKWRWVKFASIGVLLFVVAGAGGAGLAYLNAPPVVTVPDEVAKKVTFPLYVPRRLPANFYIDKDVISEKDGSVLFYATNGTQEIFFSQQAKPKQFDFGAFYQRQMTNTRSVADAPFATTLGTAPDGSYLMSIVAHETWLLVTAPPETKEADLQFVARSLVRQ